MKLVKATSYSKIYDIVKENQTLAGKDLVFSQNSFCSSCEQPKYADLQGSEELNDENFLNFVYIACLNRMIDDKALEFWQLKMHRAPRNFRKKLMMHILMSSEFRQLGKICVNNPYEIRFMKIKMAFLVSLNWLKKAFLFR
jgi:hypothetical protein